LKQRKLVHGIFAALLVMMQLLTLLQIRKHPITDRLENQ
jgi:hypothetical protein